MKRFAWIFALAAGVASAETPSPYRVTIDVGPAIAALGSEDLFESDPAQDRLQALGPAALPALRAALAREPASVRTGVVEVLSHLGADGLPALLGVATHDPDPEVRHDAIIDLGVAKDPRGRPVVERLLKHDDARDRLAAVQACATLCATPGALRRLVRIAIEDPSMATGMAARRSLGTITASAGNRRAAVVATIARAAVPRITRAATIAVRARAAIVAADVGDATGSATLGEAALGVPDAHLRLNAIYALGTGGDATGVPALARILAGQNDGARLYAADALRRMAARGVTAASQALAEAPVPVPQTPVPPLGG